MGKCAFFYSISYYIIKKTYRQPCNVCRLTNGRGERGAIEVCEEALKKLDTNYCKR